MVDCPEIQEKWEPKEGDRFLIKSGYFTNRAEPGNGESWYDKGEIVTAGDGVVPYNDYPHGQTRADGSKYSFDNGEYIWLPRQEDIQEMLKVEYFALPSIAITMNENADYWYRFDKWDEFWIAYYMNCVHNKTWDGENWQ